MISIRQRKGIQTTEVSEDYTAQEENVKLEDKLPSSMWFKLKQHFGLFFFFCLHIEIITLQQEQNLERPNRWRNLFYYLRVLQMIWLQSDNIHFTVMLRILWFTGVCSVWLCQPDLLTFRVILFPTVQILVSFLFFWCVYAAHSRQAYLGWVSQFIKVLKDESKHFLIFYFQSNSWIFFLCLFGGGEGSGQNLVNCLYSVEDFC